MTKCIENCEACGAPCEGYGCYDGMSVAENKAVENLEKRIFDLQVSWGLVSREHSHTEEEMDKEFRQPIKKLEQELHYLKGFLGLN
jgi:archaellum component FlaC